MCGGCGVVCVGVLGLRGRVRVVVCLRRHQLQLFGGVGQADKVPSFVTVRVSERGGAVERAFVCTPVGCRRETGVRMNCARTLRIRVTQHEV